MTTNALRILIIEDEVIIADDLQDTLESLGYAVVSSVMSYEDAIEVLQEETVDLALIDIQLASEKSGIDVATYIRKYLNMPFVFLTSNADVATVKLAKETKPNGYLVKPFEQEDIFTAIEIALSNYSGNNVVERELKTPDFNDSIFVKENNLYHRILISDIIYLKSDNVYVEIHTSSRKYIDRATLKHYEEKLSSQHFFKSHKSYIINQNYIEAISSKDIIVNGKSLPMSRDFKDLFMKNKNK